MSRSALFVNPSLFHLILGAKGGSTNQTPLGAFTLAFIPSEFLGPPPEPFLLSISRSLDLSNSQQSLLSLTGNIRNCRSPPTYSRDPLSDAMIGLTTPLRLRGLFGAALVCEASHMGLISLQLTTISTFSTRKCLELLPTSNGSSRYTVRGQLLNLPPRYYRAPASDCVNVSGPTGHLALDQYPGYHFR